MPASLANAFSWWSSYYGDHQAISVTIRFLHLAAMLVGGGAAITIDRQVFRERRVTSPRRGFTIAMLNGAHGLVVASLVLIVVTGTLMAGADVDTYLVSPLFWIKMGLFAGLLLNGAALARAGRGATVTDLPRRLVVTSVVSVILWLVIVYASTWLMVAA